MGRGGGEEVGHLHLTKLDKQLSFCIGEYDVDSSEKKKNVILHCEI